MRCGCSYFFVLSIYSMSSARYSLSFALALVLVLIVIGLGIRRQAYRAIAPPIYDPLGYIKKAKRSGRLLQGEALRGPRRPARLATPRMRALLLSVWISCGFPVLSLLVHFFASHILWALSVYLALGKCERTLREYLLPVAWGVGLISLPMFYHFELSGVNESPFIGQWGLQDCLLASMAALATIMTIIGARNRLFSLSVLGWSSAAYSLFIKPAGLLVMLSVAWVWFIEISNFGAAEPTQAS